MTTAHNAKAREIVANMAEGCPYRLGTCPYDICTCRVTIATALRDCEREAFEAGQRDAIATLSNAPETTPEHVARVFIDRERLHYRTEFDVGCVARLAEVIRRARCDGALKAEREALAKAVEASWNEARRVALEEAAKVADKHARDVSFVGSPHRYAEEIAASIRALAQEEPER